MPDYTLDRFPVSPTLRDGSACIIRPITEADEDAFQEFHSVIPERECLFIRSQIRDGSLFRQWSGDLEFEMNLPLLAFIDGQISAMGVLQQRPGGWKRHIGKVHFLTHPDYVGLGLIDVVVEQIVESARQYGLVRLESELNGERESAISAMTSAGFTELVRLPNYIQDMNAENHDFVLMGMELIASFENLGTGD